MSLNGPRVFCRALLRVRLGPFACGHGVTCSPLRCGRAETGSRKSAFKDSDMGRIGSGFEWYTPVIE